MKRDILTHSEWHPSLAWHRHKWLCSVESEFSDDIEFDGFIVCPIFPWFVRFLYGRFEGTSWFCITGFIPDEWRNIYNFQSFVITWCWWWTGLVSYIHARSCIWGWRIIRFWTVRLSLINVNLWSFNRLVRFIVRWLCPDPLNLDRGFSFTRFSLSTVSAHI